MVGDLATTGGGNIGGSGTVGQTGPHRVWLIAGITLFSKGRKISGGSRFFYTSKRGPLKREREIF